LSAAITLRAPSFAPADEANVDSGVYRRVRGSATELRLLARTLRRAVTELRSELCGPGRAQCASVAEALADVAREVERLDDLLTSPPR